MSMERNENHWGVEERNQRGFTLLLAALVASITLALGTAIFELAQKELTLSSIGRDSQYAFYAADTGAECALYWDSRHQRFPTTTPTSVQVVCDNQTKNTSSSGVGNTVDSSFQFDSNGYCVNVKVSKTKNTQTGSVSTIVHADGFSARCDTISSSFRLLQRSVELYY